MRENLKEICEDHSLTVEEKKKKFLKSLKENEWLIDWWNSATNINLYLHNNHILLIWGSRPSHHTPAIGQTLHFLQTCGIHSERFLLPPIFNHFLLLQLPLHFHALLAESLPPSFIPLSPSSLSLKPSWTFALSPTATALFLLLPTRCSLNSRLPSSPHSFGLTMRKKQIGYATFHMFGGGPWWALGCWGPSDLRLAFGLWRFRKKKEMAIFIDYKILCCRQTIGSRWFWRRRIGFVLWCWRGTHFFINSAWRGFWVRWALPFKYLQLI